MTAVAHELAANSVVHGAGHGRLRLWAADGFLYCQVSDGGRDGTADQPDQPASPTRPALPGDGAAPWPVQHGHGLWLVGQLADRVDIAPGPAGTTTTARFPLGPPRLRPNPLAPRVRHLCDVYLSAGAPKFDNSKKR